jgi:hypothetical protein
MKHLGLVAIRRNVAQTFRAMLSCSCQLAQPAAFNGQRESRTSSDRSYSHAVTQEVSKGEKALYFFGPLMGNSRLLTVICQ